MKLLKMRPACFFLALALAFGLSGCGQSRSPKRSAPPVSEGKPAPQGSQGTGADPARLQLTEKRDQALAEYKALGISLDLSGISSLIGEQQGEKLDQLLTLLPEFEKLTTYVARLEIVIGVNRYSAQTKQLSFVVRREQDANEAYLRAFGNIRSYEQRLGGPEIDDWAAAQTAESIEKILTVCQSLKLAELVQGKSYIKTISFAGLTRFFPKNQTLYIRTDASADAVSSELEFARKWNLLSVALNCEVIDSTNDSLLRLDFEPAMDVLIQKLDLMRPVADLIRKIEITRFESPLTFDLATGAFQLSKIDAESSDDLWLALADYKSVMTKLNVPFEFTKGVMNKPSILRSGMRLVLENLDTLVSKRERFKGFKMTELPDSRIDQDAVIWIGSEQTSEGFRSFVDAL